MSDLLSRLNGRPTPEQRLRSWIAKIDPPPHLNKRPLRYDVPKKTQIALRWTTSKVWLQADGSFIRDDTREVIGHLTKA